jgi:hypothetical protein
MPQADVPKHPETLVVILGFVRIAVRAGWKASGMIPARLEAQTGDFV